MECLDIYQTARTLSQFDADKDAAMGALERFTSTYTEAVSGDVDKSSLDEAMEYCFRTIAGKLPLLTAAIGSWLTRDSFLELGRDFLHSADVQYLQHSALLDIDLSSLSVHDAVLAGYRLCGYASTPAIALSWIFAVHRDFASSEFAQQHACHLAAFHADEYPGSTLKLSSNKSAVLASTLLAASIGHRLQQLDERMDALPRLKELAMTPEMRLILSSIHRKQNREVTRHSESKSLFARLFTSQYFKYANRTAMTVHSGAESHEASLEMALYSISVELPLSELTDPMHGLVTRIQLSKGPQ